MKATTPEQAIDMLLSLGTVKQVDSAGARVKIERGEIITDWVKWFATYSGTHIDWSSPSVGEQGMLLAPSGDLTNAVFLRGVYSDATPPPSNDEQTWKVKFKNGDTIEHNGDDYIAKITGHIDLTGSTCTITADTTINGNLHVTGKVTTDGDIVSAGKITDSDGNNGA